jgi:hypothetical protein
LEVVLKVFASDMPRLNPITPTTTLSAADFAAAAAESTWTTADIAAAAAAVDCTKVRRLVFEFSDVINGDPEQQGGRKLTASDFASKQQA